MAALAFRNPLVTVCLVVLSAVALATVLGSLLTPQDPMHQDIALGAVGPSQQHWLGTDDLGRDVFSRMIAGARTVVLGSVMCALGSTLIGTSVGLLSGYANGRVDTLLMRTADIVWAFPALLTILVVVGVFDGGYVLAVVVLIVFAWPLEARLVRGAVMVQKRLPYVEAAHTLDLSDRRIVVRHILPNLLPLILTNILLGFVSSLVVLSGLSFLGLGVAPGTPDWGLMINENRSILDLNIWGALAPAACLIAVSLAATIAADRGYAAISARSGAR
jgi:ABC-type dipeptide/oligopeptide/nickel transport system permease subunit